MAERLQLQYDKRRDVLYVSRGHGGTRNLPFTPHEDIQLDHETYEVVGYIITNFSHEYPRLSPRLNLKDRWFVKDFFEGRLNDWNSLLAPLRSAKARVNFLMRERTHLHGSLAHR